MGTSHITHIRIAKRYARALYDSAQQADVALNLIEEQLQALVSLHSDSDEFHTLCESPLIKEAQKHHAIDAIAQHIGLHSIITSFLHVATENHRLSLLPSMYEQMQHIIQREKGEEAVTIITAKKLGLKDKNALTEAMSNALSKPVSATAIIDKRLIGGVKIRYGSYELDASVKGKLAQAQKKLYETIQTL